MTKVKNLSKSNRAQADYFELLVCQYICHLYGVTFSYSQNLAELSNKVLALLDGQIRLKLQNDNLIKLKEVIKKILDREVKDKGKVIGVIWTGRNLLIQSTSDVDAKHTSNKFTKFSIKSIASAGTGTLKNIGLKNLEKFYHFDFSKQNKEMWDKFKQYLGDKTLSQSALKKKAKNNKQIMAWAKKNGQKYQHELNNLCFRGFNALPAKEKINFLNFITDCKDLDLYVIIANANGAIVYKPVDKNIKLIDKIEAKKNKTSGVGYSIYINGIQMYRIQTNNTNGVGISAFCQRVFLV